MVRVILMEKPHKIDLYVHIKGEQYIRHLIIAGTDSDPGEIDYQLNEGVYLPHYLETLRKMPGFKSEAMEPIATSRAPFAVLPNIFKFETFYIGFTPDFYKGVPA
jgi:hypothetical protein